MGARCTRHTDPTIDEAWRVMYFSKAEGKKNLKQTIKLYKPRRYSIFETPDFFMLVIGRPPADLARQKK